MAVLEQRSTGKRYELLPDTLIGRSKECWIELDAQGASRLHARVSWGQQGWVLQDLSQNGTRLNGAEVTRGQSLALKRGDALHFAGGGEVWELASAEPPRAALFPLPGGDAIPLSPTPVALPTPDELSGSAYLDVDGFAVLEQATGLTPLSDGQIVELSARRYRVSLPQALPSTLALQVALAQATLSLRPSRNQEHVDASVTLQGHTVHLRPRSHLQLLLFLARERRNDQQTGLAPRDAGWADVEQVCRELDVSRETLNAHVFRLREVFAELQLADATAIIERRFDSDELRIGAVQIDLPET